MPGTTPVYGFPYPEPTDLVADYPALGQDLAEDIEAVLPTIGGLAPVAPTSIANSGGSASTTANTTTFTTVSSISLNGVFSATYDHYRIMIRFTAASAADTSGTMRLRASGTDNSGATAYREQVGYFLGATTVASANNTSSWRVADTATSYPYGSGAIVDLMGPFIAQRTGMSNSHWFNSSVNSQYTWVSGGAHTESVAYDGFSLLSSSGTFSGTISVFGYKK
jgi:hypothetical protein